MYLTMLPDEILDKVSVNFENVSVDNPTYPWPSKAVSLSSCQKTNAYLSSSIL